MRRPGAAALGLALLCAAVAPAAAAAEPAAGVPRDEPMPMDPGLPTGGELPDYGPPPEDEAAPPANRPRPAVPPLVIKRVPRLKLTYQRMIDHKIGGQEEPFNIGALSFYPLSDWVRLGATLRYGVAQTSGKRSYFMDALVAAGLQWPEAVRGLTPFLEFSVGPGFRMFTTFNNILPSLQWTFGVDAGLEIHLGGRLYLSGAVGWTRPVVSIKQASVGRQTVDVYGDTFIFKVGLGI